MKRLGRRVGQARIDHKEREDTAARQDSEAGDDPYAERRAEMVSRQLQQRGISDQRVLAAMGRVPREKFLPRSQRASAYADRALRLACGQTVSQPYVVAATLQALRLRPDDRVLEVGAGSGYAAAVAGQLAAAVVAVERIESLATRARARLADLDCHNVTIVWGDGMKGYAPAAPYQAIFLSAAAAEVPEALFDQLAPGGRLVAPVGRTDLPQQLALYEHAPSPAAGATGATDTAGVAGATGTVGAVESTGATEASGTTGTTETAGASAVSDERPRTTLMGVAFVPLLPGVRRAAN